MLFSLAMIIILGFTLGGILKKIKLPAFVGMILTGIILGPYMLNVISSEILNISSDLREIALIIILIRAGLSLDLKDFKEAGRPAIMLCFIPSIFEFFTVLFLAPIFFHIPYIEAAILGAVMSAVSLAVVVPSMIKLMEKGYGTDKKIPQMIMAGASIDNVFIVVIFSVFMGIWGGSGVGVMTFLEVPLSILLGVSIGAVGGILMHKLFKTLHIRDTMKILLLLSSAFLVMELQEKLKGIVPISGLVAVVFIGITILKRDKALAARLSGRLSKIWVLAEIILFVLVGASVDIHFLSKAGILAVVLIVIELITRTIGVFISLLGSKLNGKERTFCAISYVPKATVQAAIASVPLNKGVASGNIILAIAVLSIFITSPLGAVGIDMLHKKMLRHFKIKRR